MRVLVTGATGFIGRRLVERLLADGQSVSALVRPSSGPLPPGVAGVSSPAGFDLVFHLAGPYKGSDAELWAAHAEGTAALVRALDPGARLVYVSSTSVYGWDQDWPANADSPVRPESAYGWAKAAAEEVARSHPGPVVVLRPTITYGPGDVHGMLPRTARLLRWLPGDGTNRIHLTHVDDLVEALVLAGSGGAADGHTYVIAGPGPSTMRSIGTWVGAASGRSPRFVLPRPVLAAAARVPGSPVSMHSVEVATRDRAYDSLAATRDLGWVGVRDPAVEVPKVAKHPATGEMSGALGFDWHNYVEDPDEGLGTVYERFGLDSVIRRGMEATGSTSVLHAPGFGMMGIPGLDGVLLARDGVRVGIADHDPERLAFVESTWKSLGLEPELHLLPGADPATWPATLLQSYNLVFSFAALWWYGDPWSVLEAQARWAGKAVVVSVPNRNVFMRLRASVWHRELFASLVNPAALSPGLLSAAASRLGLAELESGLFDLPPFPDTSVPLAKVLRAARRKEASDADAWKWSILPYLRGEQPDLPETIAKLERFEARFPKLLAPHWAHHRYVIYRT